MKFLLSFPFLFLYIFTNSQSIYVPSIQLKPIQDVNRESKAIQVSYQVIRTDKKDLPLSLYFSSLEPFLSRGTDTVQNLTLKDRIGAIAYYTGKDTSLLALTFHQFITSRPVSDTVHVEYTVPVAIPFPKKRGPHMDLQATGNGLAGVFIGWLLFPYVGDTISTDIKWKLPPAFAAVSTFGEGDFHVHTSFESFAFTQFMVGSMYRYPKQHRESGFSLFALGRNKKELDSMTAWPLKAYNALRDRLDGSAKDAFRFMMRSYSGGPLQSGIAAHGSFLIYLPPQQKATDPNLRGLISHEMVHAFVLSLSDTTGKLFDWYEEGIADYLGLMIPYWTGIYTKEEYKKLVNQEAALYYTNSFRNTPDSLIASIKWSGRNAWSLGYSRGALYFANLEAGLNEHTNGKITVIDLINEITRMNKRGLHPNEEYWIRLLNAKAGIWAVEEWKQMMNGTLLIPHKNAFKGLTPVERTSGFFDLGFSLKGSVREGEIIQEVDPDGPAAKVGIKKGDVIAETISINDTYSSYDNTLTIKIKRGTEILQFKYQPRKGQYRSFEFQ